MQNILRCDSFSSDTRFGERHVVLDISGTFKKDQTIRKDCQSSQNDRLQRECYAANYMHDC